jgi:hypothetical protein
MKKYIFSLMAIAITAFSLSSCEDVPSPYDDPNNSKSDTTDVIVDGDNYLDETFATGFGKFTVKTTKGTDWIIDYKTAKATGYDSNTKTYTPSESYLVSPAVNLSGASEAYLTFDYILRYVKDGTANKVLITDNYTGDPTTTTWTDITNTLTEGSDWTTFVGYSHNIPATFIGKSKVVIALYYSCNSSTSSTWEVKNLKLQKGHGTDTGTTTPTDPTTGSDYINENFATSFGSFTAKTLKGTSWIVDYSTAKGTGYDSSTKTYTPSESYLVSKAIDLTSSKGAVLSFDYILRYVSAATANKVLICSDYNDDPSKATWTDMTGKLTEGADWKTFAKYSVNIPAAFIGKSNVRIALYFSCTSENSSTWEVKNLVLAEGSASGGNTGGDTGGETTGNSIKLTLSDLGLANAADLGTITLSDGTKLTFAQGDGSNAPKYYTSGTSARMYAKNTLSIDAGTKKITKVVLNCSTYNGTNYVGNESMYATAGSSKITPSRSDAVVTFSGFSGSTLNIINDYTSSTGGTQLRIVSMTITYSE